MVLLYLVISSKPEYYEVCEEVLMNYVEYKVMGECLLVKEYGKKGDHPHLNLVYSDHTVRHVKNMYRKIQKIFDDKDERIRIENPKLIKIKKVSNIKILINGYLKKEEKKEILYKRGVLEYKKEKSLLQEKINQLVYELAGLNKSQVEEMNQVFFNSTQ